MLAIALCYTVNDTTFPQRGQSAQSRRLHRMLQLPSWVDCSPHIQHVEPALDKFEYGKLLAASISDDDHQIKVKWRYDRKQSDSLKGLSQKGWEIRVLLMRLLLRRILY